MTKDTDDTPCLDVAGEEINTGDPVSIGEDGKIYKYNTGRKDVEVTIISGKAWISE